MPMDQPELERRTIQNTDDILSIYDLLSTMDGTLAKHTVQLTNIQRRIDAHDARFDAHDARFDGIDTRLDSLDTKLDEVLRRLPG
jgi:hypothetical protein